MFGLAAVTGKSRLRVPSIASVTCQIHRVKAVHGVKPDIPERNPACFPAAFCGRLRDGFFLVAIQSRSTISFHLLIDELTN